MVSIEEKPQDLESEPIEMDSESVQKVLAIIEMRLFLSVCEWATNRSTKVDRFEVCLFVPESAKGDAVERRSRGVTAAID
jgi:hypothetical protein